MHRYRSAVVAGEVVACVVVIVTAAALVVGTPNHRTSPAEAAAAGDPYIEGATKVRRPTPSPSPVRRVASPVRIPITAPAAGLPTVPIKHINPEHGDIALTFDDGPDPRWTGQVLALLAQYHMHATFCLIGEYARQYPTFVSQMVAAGHSLCDHTYRHDEHVGSRPSPEIRADLQTTYDAIVAASGGVAPRYFRAPAGVWTPALIAEARAEGMTPLDWAVDARDWQRPGVPVIVKTILDQVQPGSIVLMHDGYGHREQTVAALRQLLPALVARGLHSVAL